MWKVFAVVPRCCWVEEGLAELYNFYSNAKIVFFDFSQPTDNSTTFSMNDLSNNFQFLLILMAYKPRGGKFLESVFLGPRKLIFSGQNKALFIFYFYFLYFL